MNSFFKKQPLYKCFPLLLLPLLAGCSKQEEGPVPVSLTAQSRSMEAEGRSLTVINARDGFRPTLFSTTVQGDYTYAVPDPYSWQKDVTVAAQTGAITFTAISPVTEEKVADGHTPEGLPCYPIDGAWMYLTGIHPRASAAAGVITYTIDGKTDLMYAPEIQGNKWKGESFPPLVFGHLLSQLQLRATKREDGGLSVRVTSITLKEVERQVSFPLETGTPAFTFTTDRDFTVPDADIADTEITGKDGPVELVTLLLPPRDSNTYTMDVETTIGVFTNVQVMLDSKESQSNSFLPGYIYTITLNITDRALTVEQVTVSPWNTTDADGEMGIH